MLDFVILYHELPAASKRNSHWDLMLRNGDRLLTWALDVDPLVESKANGQRLPDHRLEYLQYEGQVSGDRGSVTRIAKGSYRWLMPISEPIWQVELSLDEGKILIKCAGGKCFEFERL